MGRERHRHHLRRRDHVGRGARSGVRRLGHLYFKPVTPPACLPHTLPAIPELRVPAAGADTHSLSTALAP